MGGACSGGTENGVDSKQNKDINLMLKDDKRKMDAEVKLLLLGEF